MPQDARGTLVGTMKNTMGMTDSVTLGHKSVIDKQRAAIEKLRGQNEQLKSELLLENKFSVRPGDPFIQALINRLQDEGDMLARKIVLEMRKCRFLDQHLSEVNNTLSSTRTLMGGINNAKEQYLVVKKKMLLLENRLEKSYVKYNKSITHNKELREQINNLRQERMMFESIDSNLQRELQKLKKDMAEMIQMANHNFEAKEKVINEMTVLKSQADKEQQGFEDEWKHLTAIIEEEKRERERARASELAMRERETQELLKAGTMSLSSKKKTSRGLNSSQGNKSMAQNVAAEKVQMYGQAFEKIQQATGLEDIDMLVNTFITAEDQNYTLFNYVNEVNQEIEKLEDQITAIKREIDRYKCGGTELDGKKSAQVRDVEERLAAAETQADLYEKRYESASGTVNLLKTSIWDLFNKIGCNTPAVRDLLGEDGVTEANVMAYLGIIEQRTNELVQAYAHHSETPDALLDSLLAQPLTNTSNRIIIEPPSTTQQAEEIDGIVEEVDDEKPMTRENLESQVNKTLPRKLETAIKVRPPVSDSTKRSPGRR